MHDIRETIIHNSYVRHNRISRKTKQKPILLVRAPFLRTSSLISTIYTSMVSHDTVPTSIGRGVNEMKIEMKIK